MILLFDLDRTIIDTDKFKKGLSTLFGISIKKFNNQIDSFFRETNTHYSPEAHIKVLRKQGHIKNATEEKQFDKLYQHFLNREDNYLFTDAKKTLAALEKQGHHLILITLGTPIPQRRKVEASGINKYFEKIIYETKDKSQNKFIKQLAKSKENILIINDKANEALAIKKIIGERAKIFLVKSPHSKNTEHKEKIHKDIRVLKSIL